MDTGEEVLFVLPLFKLFSPSTPPGVSVETTTGQHFDVIANFPVGFFHTTFQPSGGTEDGGSFSEPVFLSSGTHGLKRQSKVPTNLTTQETSEDALLSFCALQACLEGVHFVATETVVSEIDIFASSTCSFCKHNTSIDPFSRCKSVQ